MKKGTLLLVSKAFALVDKNGPPLELPKALEKKIRLQPKRYSEVAVLHYGGERSADTMTWKSM